MCTKNGTNDFANFTWSHTYGRSITRALVSVCIDIRVTAAADSRVTYVILVSVDRVYHSVCLFGCVRVRARVSYEGCVWLQTASVQRIFRRRVVVGPGRILRVARSLNPPDPSAPFFLPPLRLLSFASVGVEGESFSFAPPSQGTTLQLE